MEHSQVYSHNICLKACSLFILQISDDVLYFSFNACVVLAYLHWLVSGVFLFYSADQYDRIRDMTETFNF